MGAPEPVHGSARRPADVHDVAGLGTLLRALRRRHARRAGAPELTYREIAVATGWSHGIVGEYLAGRTLPPTDRFDVLVRLLGATPAEQGTLATARDRVEEARRRGQAAAGARAARVPRQLPSDVPAFTGRDGELAELHDLLDGDGPPAAVICVLAGTAGVGKTALAVHWAHRVASRFPDGQLYLDLRGYDPEQPVTAVEALAALLRGLGVPGTDVPAEPAERAARYRSELAGRRVLVLLDNAASAGQVRPLLPGTAGCFTLVTSRDTLAGFVARDGARRIDLDVLTSTDAVRLLRALIGDRGEPRPQDTAALAERCARLPLALRVAAELTVADSAGTLADLVVRLDDEQQRLDLLDAAGDGRTAVRSVFSWSLRRLTDAGTRAFLLLGLHPGQHIDAEVVAALIGTTVERAQAPVAELARAHLIEVTTPGAWAMHDLLQSYAAERVTAEMAASARGAALNRLLDHYRAAAARAAQVLFPHDRPGHQAGTPSPTLRPGIDSDSARGWLDRHRSNLVAVALYAARHGHPRHSAGLSCALWRYFEVGGYFQDALAVHSSAVLAVPHADPARPGVLANLGSIRWWLGHHQESRQLFDDALAAHQTGGDLDGKARILARLGLVHERLGDYDTALLQMGEALTLYQYTGNRHGEAGQLLNLGAVHRRRGRYDEAARRHQHAAVLFADMGEARLEGYALGNLGAVCSLLGRHAEALTHLRQALARCVDAGDRGGEGSALGTIGVVYRRLGRYDDALDHLHRALTISRDTGDRSVETETLNTLGETLLAMGQPTRAIDHHRSALAITEQTADRFEHARALAGIADVLDSDSALDSGTARQHRHQALAIFEALGVPDADRIQKLLTR